MSGKDRLRMRFEELAKCGLFIDDQKGIASVKLNASVYGNFKRAHLAKDANLEGDVSINEDENYLYVPVRALSETFISDRDIDFTSAGVIKNSSKLLLGQTVYTNHVHDVNTWVGVVVKTWYEAESGIPAGIDATLRVNKKWNDRLSDGIKDGAVHSVSVDVYFDYKKSHPDLNDFWFLLGEEVEGEIVRLIATKIISYSEISFVWQGADTFAKRIGFGKDTSEQEGSEVNIEKEKVAAEEENKTEGEEMKLSRKDAEKMGLPLSDLGFRNGVQEVEVDESKFLALVEHCKSLSDEAAFYRDTLSKSGIEPDDEMKLIGKLTSLSALAKCGEAHLSGMRDEALKFAKLAQGEDGVSDALEKAIKNASLEDATKFRDDYRKQAEKKVPLKCEKCGGTMSRRSSEKEDIHGNSNTAETFNENDYKI